MGNIKILLIGVSDYTTIDQQDLPFCKNDLALMQRTISNVFEIDPEDIISLGWAGTVNCNDFLNSLLLMKSRAQQEDSMIIYFSGHGGVLLDNHRLVFSDGFITTQKIIEAINGISVKNKLILLDSCYSGDYKILPGENLDPNDWLDSFVNNGCAVLASSSKNQKSRLHPEQGVSIFTYFLCLAFTGHFRSRKEAISLDQICETLFVFLERWNKANPGFAQTPVYRTNIGGTIMFPTKNPNTYHVNTLVSEHENYTICSVEPVHFANIKRLRVKAIIKGPVTPEGVADINWEIINEISYADIYQTEIAEQRFKGKPANIVFCFFGYDEEDLANCIYPYHTTWADQNQDRNHWYAPTKHSKIIRDIHIVINDGYDSVKAFEQAHTGDKQEIIAEEKAIVADVVKMAERVIREYREYRNEEIEEPELIERLKAILPQIEDLFLKESELDIPPAEIHDWVSACTSLINTVHDFVFYYKENYIGKRTVENRRQCMDMTIRRYHEDLKKLQDESNRLGI